ncbi:MAG: ABC transporter ATP-binding protein [Planctomycetes bacterium]|nr:ABC transporter ATP-binding protein [Planctomycetota bacterium]
MSAPSQVTASLRGVVKRYGRGHTAFTALRGIDLDVRAGELTLLMGPSGSGKTTLISILGCLLEPTEGSVEIRGQRVDSLGERRLPAVRLRNIGFVFQGFNLLRSLTAIENVEVPLFLCGVHGRRARARALELLESLGLEGKERQLTEDLSGGEKQRVAIARALAADPPLVLADEPTAALDTRTGWQMMEALRDRAHGGVAVMVVTHDVRLEALADRIVRIEDGRLVA